MTYKSYGEYTATNPTKQAESIDTLLSKRDAALSAGHFELAEEYHHRFVTAEVAESIGKVTTIGALHCALDTAADIGLTLSQVVDIIDAQLSNDPADLSKSAAGVVARIYAAADGFTKIESEKIRHNLSWTSSNG